MINWERREDVCLPVFIYRERVHPVERVRELEIRETGIKDRLVAREGERVRLRE